MVRALLPIPEPAPATLEVTGERLHYLTRVLRLTPGDPLEIFDGRGRAFAAKVATVGESSATLAVGEPVAAAGAVPVFIVQGLPKGDKLEWVIQKGTELGAAGFSPAVTDRAVVKLDAKRAQERQARWQKIAEEAARQCGRSDVPTVAPVRPLAEAVAAYSGAQVLVLDEEERAVRLSKALLGVPAARVPAEAASPGAGAADAGPVADGETPMAPGDGDRSTTSGRAAGPIVLVIGPEGGLSRDEVSSLVAQGARTVTLGSRVLRTETAALAALAVIAHLAGELG
jgi:16S rRNA (uracil1498-N3)-methyltransferase